MKNNIGLFIARHCGTCGVWEVRIPNKPMIYTKDVIQWAYPNIDESIDINNSDEIIMEHTKYKIQYLDGGIWQDIPHKEIDSFEESEKGLSQLRESIAFKDTKLRACKITERWFL